MTESSPETVPLSGETQMNRRTLWRRAGEMLDGASHHPAIVDHHDIYVRHGPMPDELLPFSHHQALDLHTQHWFVWLLAIAGAVSSASFAYFVFTYPVLPYFGALDDQSILLTAYIAFVGCSMIALPFNLLITGLKMTGSPWRTLQRLPFGLITSLPLSVVPSWIFAPLFINGAVREETRSKNKEDSAVEDVIMWLKRGWVVQSLALIFCHLGPTPATCAARAARLITVQIGAMFSMVQYFIGITFTGPLFFFGASFLMGSFIYGFVLPVLHALDLSETHRVGIFVSIKVFLAAIVFSHCLIKSLMFARFTDLYWDGHRLMSLRDDGVPVQDWFAVRTLEHFVQSGRSEGSLETLQDRMLELYGKDDPFQGEQRIEAKTADALDVVQRDSSGEGPLVIDRPDNT